MNNILQTIKDANKERSILSTKRRLLKIGEEKGEVCEAILNVTSDKNGKNKSWDDVREELVDCFIVAADIGLTFDENMTFDFHIRHIDKYDENKFIDKMLLTGHLLSSLNYNLKCCIPKTHECDSYEDCNMQDGKCISKSLVLIFYELATLIFPDKDNSTEEELFGAFSKEIDRKITKWVSK